ncbi:MAG: glycosyltransferase family protein [Daejeonella sp.]|uniref:glycosyltransferase family protein n=1 Tax=Daejeonella sp. TaxID=2805397 RepID=UPI0027368A73|nr:glycosyltransferase family protein [Daejeonella sp.]MDP3469899.1 glycosyltransferase family protein [Daejeonella sp.]
MRILYAIQGTGNGHLSRAMDVIPCLMKHAEVDILVSGIQGDLVLPYQLSYKMRGLSFIFGKSGGVDIWKTCVKSNIGKLVKEINSLPVEDYDLVINDFEPISAWACYARNVPCIGLSHQSAVLADEAPKTDNNDVVGRLILKNYAPNTAHYGFHFKAYGENIFTPVIRKQVRDEVIHNHGHYAVYLPAYDDSRLIATLTKFKSVNWDVFSKHNHKPYKTKNVSVQPIHNERFIRSMASSEGILCGAGFETPAEALYMKKKLLVVPMKNQYEQQLNAAALSQMGVPVIRNLNDRFDMVINNWIESNRIIDVDYPDKTQEIIDQIIEKHCSIAVIRDFRKSG